MIRCGRLTPLGLLLALVFLSTVAFAEIRVINLLHRPAAEIAEVIRPMMGERGRVSTYSNQLIVQADEKTLASIAELVRSLDLPAQSLRITVRQIASSGHSQDRAGISGTLRTRDIRVGVGSPVRPPASGLEIGGPGRNHPRLNYSRRLGNMRTADEQFLQVLDGQQALITVGQQVPFVRYQEVVAGRNFAASQEVDFREVTTGFRVRPHLQGDQVSLEITPHMAALRGGGEGILDFQSLTTHARVPLGVWYNLAGHLSEHDQLSRSILSIGAGEGSESHEVWIRVDR